MQEEQDMADDAAQDEDSAGSKFEHSLDDDDEDTRKRQRKREKEKRQKR